MYSVIAYIHIAVNYMLIALQSCMC